MSAEQRADLTSDGLREAFIERTTSAEHVGTALEQVMQFQVEVPAADLDKLLADAGVLHVARRQRTYTGIVAALLDLLAAGHIAITRDDDG